jgi:hypothetical protein
VNGTNATATEKKPRVRRTPEQIVADLQAEIERVQRRAAAREVRKTDEGRAFIVAVRALDKAGRAAVEAGDEAMARVLESARATLGEHLVAMGVRVPTSRRGRRMGA